MFEYQNVLVLVLVLLVIGVFKQLSQGIYYLGCFRRYNQIFDTIENWFDEIDPDEAIEVVRNFVFIAFALALIIAVYI